MLQDPSILQDPSCQFLFIAVRREPAKLWVPHRPSGWEPWSGNGCAVGDFDIGLGAPHSSGRIPGSPTTASTYHTFSQDTSVVLGVPYWLLWKPRGPLTQLKCPDWMWYVEAVVGLPGILPLGVGARDRCRNPHGAAVTASRFPPRRPMGTHSLAVSLRTAINKNWLMGLEG